MVANRTIALQIILC